MAITVKFSTKRPLVRLKKGQTVRLVIKNIARSPLRIWQLNEQDNPLDGEPATVLPGDWTTLNTQNSIDVEAGDGLNGAIELEAI